jgi:Trypsin-like peptidase domain
MTSCSRLLFVLALLGCVFAAPSRGDTLKITSTPSGATVEINAVVVGTRPYEEQVPGIISTKPRQRSVDAFRIQWPQVSASPAIQPKEIQMTEGPLNWVSLKGHNHGEYWLLKLKRFHVDLDPISKVFTGNISAEIPEAGEASLDADVAADPIEGVIARAKPAVVRLKGYGKSGSGFFVTEKGAIATNAHLARGEGSLLAILPSGQQLAASVIHLDADRDIALVKVEGDDFPYLSLGAASNVRQGETVIAIGNPGDAMSFAVTKGIVSAVGQFSPAGPGIWIHTDATIRAIAVVHSSMHVAK